jgi:hypothetical protein
MALEAQTVSAEHDDETLVELADRLADSRELWAGSHG